MTDRGQMTAPERPAATQERKLNVVPAVPDVSRHRMAVILYRGYREWVAAGKPKRA